MGRVRNVLVTYVVFLAAAAVAFGQLQPGFYMFTCPNVEVVVRSVVRSHFRADPSVAPGLLRMHFNDCFVNGCDGSILIDGPDSEKYAPPNQNLKGFEVIDQAKARLEASCPGTVSCADIIALAARDAVSMTGGPTWSVPLGRRDGRVSQASDVMTNLPGPFDTVVGQKQIFAAKGLTTHDLVTLVGAHTIGTTSCSSANGRFYDFNNTGRHNLSIDPSFVQQIQAQCPLHGDPMRRVPLDTGSENKFDTFFFRNVRSGRGVLSSDQVLWSDPETRAIIQRYLRLPILFGPEFARSMTKMSSIGVKTGSHGEIRRSCSALN